MSNCTTTEMEMYPLHLSKSTFYRSSVIKSVWGDERNLKNISADIRAVLCKEMHRLCNAWSQPLGRVEFNGGRRKCLPFFFHATLLPSCFGLQTKWLNILNRMSANMDACIAVESISILEKLHSKGWAEIIYTQPNILNRYILLHAVESIVISVEHFQRHFLFNCNMISSYVTVS